MGGTLALLSGTLVQDSAELNGYNGSVTNTYN